MREMRSERSYNETERDRERDTTRENRREKIQDGERQTCMR